MEYSSHYINHSIGILKDADIIEYDIRSANTSIMREFQLLPEEHIQKYEKMTKKERVVAIGKLQKKYPSLNKDLTTAFPIATNRFIQKNNLSEESILSIRKDAIFVVNQPVNYTTFGHLHFEKKKEYTGFIATDLYHFLLNRSAIDVKGIDDRVLPYHQDGILLFIRNFLESYRPGNYTDAISFLKEFMLLYKRRELEFQFYREFNTMNQFQIYLNDTIIYVDSITEELLPSTNILFNYDKIIAPCVRHLLM